MGKNWHHGVIGIVSSKITEMYFKPSILLCEEGDIEKELLQFVMDIK